MHKRSGVIIHYKHENCENRTIRKNQVCLFTISTAKYDTKPCVRDLMNLFTNIFRLPVKFPCKHIGKFMIQYTNTIH